MSRRSIATIVIGRQTILRTGIASLVEEYSFDVVAMFGSVEDASQYRVVDGDPELVLICVRCPEFDRMDLTAVREQWPSCKIVLLFDHATSQQLLGEEAIDGCIPLQVPREQMIRMLKMVVFDRARILIQDENGTGEAGRLDCRANRNGHAKTFQEGHVSGRGPAVSEEDHSENEEASGENEAPMPTVSVSIDSASMRAQRHPLLSEREEAILDGLIRGLSNKQIARECGITEATVKVHMKSILRKIRVSNRTQAAIWALDRRRRSESVIRSNS